MSLVPALVALAVAGLLLDSLVLGFPCATVLGAGLALLTAPLVALWRLARRRWRAAGRALAVGAVFIGALVVVGAVHAVNAKKGRHSVLVVAEACEAYKRDHGVYPERLDQLVPRFLRAIPSTTWVGPARPMRYFPATDENPTPAIVWTKVPPYLQESYSLETGKFQHLPD